jgi:hypothetical protein
MLDCVIETLDIPVTYGGVVVTWDDVAEMPYAAPLTGVTVKVYLVLGVKPMKTAPGISDWGALGDAGGLDTTEYAVAPSAGGQDSTTELYDTETTDTEVTAAGAVVIGTVVKVDAPVPPLPTEVTVNV